MASTNRKLLAQAVAVPVAVMVLPDLEDVSGQARQVVLGAIFLAVDLQLLEYVSRASASFFIFTPPG